MPDWPDDADGDALRRIADDGVDFDVEHQVDFQIDFETWPPAKEALALLQQHYGQVNVVQPSDDADGFVEISKRMLLGYEAIVGMQKTISSLLAPFGGRCECWGVMAE